MTVKASYSLKYQCPKCGAPPGAPCRASTGMKKAGTRPHEERLDVERNEGME